MKDPIFLLFELLIAIATGGSRAIPQIRRPPQINHQTTRRTRRTRRQVIPRKALWVLIWRQVRQVRRV